jgi:peptidoglycan/xylan/chitin deacetylase (PgdA/CDA1 family)
MSFARLFFRGLRVLMYHQVKPVESLAGERHCTRSPLSVTSEQLEQQLQFLKAEKYTFISAKDLLELPQKPLPNRAVLVTFDDAYLNNLTLALPILLRYEIKATVFVPTAYIGKSNQWDDGNEPLMNVEQLKMMHQQGIDLALHSHQHQNYQHLSLAEIEADLMQNIAFFESNGLPFAPIFAYPYGGRPKNKAKQQAIQQLFAQKNIKRVFRIGNRINHAALTNPYQIQRLDIRGDESFDAFKRKVTFGKIL